MQCLWPSTKSASRVAFALFASPWFVLLAWSSLTLPFSATRDQAPLSRLEKTLHGVPSHMSEYSPASPPLALPKCGEVRPPEALLTPDPLLLVQDDDLNVRVSFIVGADGHVHSAFVLDSSGPEEDKMVLRAVRFWRYRPALCNGVPTDSEALVRFSIH